MNLVIADDLFYRAMKELSVPHKFAVERVGYFIASVNADMKSLVAYDWFSFLDNEYEFSDEVGARIGRLGMKKVMSIALKTKASLIQFHLHEFQNLPTFSKTDRDSLDEIIPALFSFSDRSPHGAVVMGRSELRYILWLKPDFEIIEGTMVNPLIKGVSNV